MHTNWKCIILNHSGIIIIIYFGSIELLAVTSAQETCGTKSARCWKWFGGEPSGQNICTLYQYQTRVIVKYYSMNNIEECLLFTWRILCAFRQYTTGAVTILAMNLNPNETAWLNLEGTLDQLPVDQYLLSPHQKDITSQ